MQSQSNDDIEVKDIAYLHPKIELTDLQTNGKLLSDEQIEAIKAEGILKEGRNGKKQLKKDNPALNDLPYGIIKTKNASGHFSYFAVYKGRKKGKSLGQGAVGSVKLAQNLDTGEWSVIKKVVIKPKTTRVAGRVIYQGTPEQQIEAIMREKTALAKMGQLIAEPYEIKKGDESKPQRSQFETLIALAPGTTPDNISEHTHMADQRWLDITINTSKRVQEVHEQDMIHKDIKPENLHVDLSSGKVTLVDFGTTIDANVTVTPVGANQHGSPAFMSPEAKVENFSTKSDVYATALTIAEILGLATTDHDFNVVLKSEEEIKQSRQSRLSNPDVEMKVWAYLRRMTDPDANKRPTIEAAIVFFNELKRDMLATTPSPIRMDYLAVNEFLSADQSGKGNIISALKNNDEVCLIDDKGLTEVQYFAIKRELEDAGLIVKSGVVQFNPEQLSSTLEKYTTQLERADNCRYFCQHISYQQGLVTSNNVASTPLKPQPPIIEKKNEKATWVRSQTPSKPQVSQLALVSEKQKKAVMDELRHEAKMLGSRDPKSKRKAAIESTMTKIGELYQERKLTYDDMHAELTKLQKQVSSENKVGKFSQRLGIFSNAQQKSIATTIKEFEKEMPPAPRSPRGRNK